MFNILPTVLSDVKLRVVNTMDLCANAYGPQNSCAEKKKKKKKKNTARDFNNCCFSFPTAQTPFMLN